MTFALSPPLPFVAGVSTISSATANIWRTAISRSLDTVNGGVYTNATEIEFASGSAGWKFSGAITAGTGTSYGLSSRSITRTQNSPIINEASGASFIAGFGAVPAGGDAVNQAFSVPHGATITTATMYISPPSARALPTSRVTIALVKRNLITGATTTVAGPTEDPNATTGSYEVYHALSLTGLSEVVDKSTSIYFLRIVGEIGGTATTVSVISSTVTMTVTALDDGA